MKIKNQLIFLTADTGLTKWKISQYKIFKMKHREKWNRKKLIRKMWSRLKGLKYSKLSLRRSKDRNNRTELILEEIMAENFTKLMKNNQPTD